MLEWIVGTAFAVCMLAAAFAMAGMGVCLWSQIMTGVPLCIVS